MVDKEKLITMTKLAIYDKNDGEADRKYMGYFRSDYVYKYNFWNRFFVLIGTIMVIIMYYAHKILIENVDIFDMDYRAELIDAATFLIIVIVFYTVIGTAIATVRYYLAQKRIKKYFALIAKLDSLSKAKDFTEEDTLENHGADIVYTRKRD